MTDVSEAADDSDDDPVAIVRRDALVPIDGDYGVFRARLPWDLVLLLAGAPFVRFAPLETALSRDHFVELGARVVAFQKDFDRRRDRTARRRKRYVPALTTLVRRFGDDAQLVAELWPAVRWLEPVSAVIREAEIDEAFLEALRPWKEEALLFLVTRAPHELDFKTVRDHLVAAAARLAGASRKKIYPTEMEGLADEAMLPSRALERALTYSPTGSPQAAFDHWIACAKNRLRDLAGQPVVLGRGPDGQEHRRARSTMRRWDHEGRLEVDENGKLRKPLSEIACEASAALRHRDPTGVTKNGAEAARLFGRSPRSVNAAIHNAIDHDAMLEPPKLPGGGYALSNADLAIIEQYLGPKRSPKDQRTVRAVARKHGVSAARVVRVIEAHLAWLKNKGRDATAARIVNSLEKWMEDGEDRELSVVSRHLEGVVRQRLAR